MTPCRMKRGVPLAKGDKVVGGVVCATGLRSVIAVRTFQKKNV